MQPLRCGDVGIGARRVHFVQCRDILNWDGDDRDQHVCLMRRWKIPDWKWNDCMQYLSGWNIFDRIRIASRVHGVRCWHVPDWCWFNQLHIVWHEHLSARKQQDLCGSVHQLPHPEHCFDNRKRSN